jgi:hypothetical protein
MTGGGLRVMEAFSVTFIYLFSYRTFYKTINNPQPYTIKEDINYKLKAMDCVKALRTADLRGRGGQISTRNRQDSGCAVSCKKSHNQRGYIGRNQNVLKHLIHKACRD